jgi:hypothetical protein
MDALKLYKLLQSHVGEMNALSHGLYNEKIDQEAASARAIQKTEALLAALKADS